MKIMGTWKDSGRSMRGFSLATDMKWSRLMRWHRRDRRGERLRQRPGPKKRPLGNPSGLRLMIRGLRHGPCRSRGLPGLYAEYREHISRRDLRALNHEVRREINREKAAALVRIEWKAPRLIWAIDDLQLKGLGVQWNHVQDMGSRYKFLPGIGVGSRGPMGGHAVAERLARLFDGHGAPLVLKRDNGGNLNHAAVEEVLAAYGVIALNSPVYYPRYNGSIEVGQREVRACLKERLALQAEWASAWGEGVVQDLNHRSRPCLEGRTSCHVFALGKVASEQYDAGKRKEVRDEIAALAEVIRGGMQETDQRAERTAWRLAIETWLRDHEMIVVTQPENVLPGFPKLWCH